MWAGCLVVEGRVVLAFVVSMVSLSEGLFCDWSFWKGLVPGWTRLRAPLSRMYTCSGVTSSQRAPWKPERHTQVCGRLHEPRFWQGGWQSAEERPQMEIKLSAGQVKACTPCVRKGRNRKGFAWTQGSTLNWFNRGAISFTFWPSCSYSFSRAPT